MHVVCDCYIQAAQFNKLLFLYLIENEKNYLCFYALEIWYNKGVRKDAKTEGEKE